MLTAERAADSQAREQPKRLKTRNEAINPQKRRIAMQVIDNIGAPPELVRIFEARGEECPALKGVVFDGFIEDLEGEMGAFEPETGLIYIDIGRCILERDWFNKGFTLIANAWMNMLFVSFHEIAHAEQLQAEPELLELNSLPAEYENQANEIAQRDTLDWAMKSKIPKLNEMGWAGDQLKGLLNQLYTTHPEAVIEELNLEGTDIAARAEIRAQASDHYSSPEDTAKLLEQIDEGIVGAKVEGKRYLTAYESITM
jgi:hypothetical protein